MEILHVLRNVGPYLFTLLITGITFSFQARSARRAREHAAGLTSIPHHAEAYRRSLALLRERDPTAEFLNEMLDWGVVNRLYLTEAAYSAFRGAVGAKGFMATKPLADLNAQAFQEVQAAPDLILKNSPRYHPA